MTTAPNWLTSQIRIFKESSSDLLVDAHKFHLIFVYDMIKQDLSRDRIPDDLNFNSAGMRDLSRHIREAWKLYYMNYNPTIILDDFPLEQYLSDDETSKLVGYNKDRDLKHIDIYLSEGTECSQEHSGWTVNKNVVTCLI